MENGKKYTSNQKKLNLILLCLIGIMVTTACRELREKKTVIKGIVYDQSTDQPVSNMTLYLHNEVSSFEPFGAVRGKVITTTKTDQDGRFGIILDLDSRARNTYTIRADLSGKQYFDGYWHFGDFHPMRSRLHVDAGVTQHLTMPLVSYGFVEVSALNNSSHGDLIFTLTSSIKGYERTCFYSELGIGERHQMGSPNLLPQGNIEFNWHIVGDDLDTNIVFEQQITMNDTNQIHFVFEG